MIYDLMILYSRSPPVHHEQWWSCSTSASNIQPVCAPKCMSFPNTSIYS